MNCSIYKNSFDNKSTEYVDIEAVLNGIEQGRWKEQIDEIRDSKTKTARDSLKKHLPAVTWSGTFEAKKVYVKKKGCFELVSKRDDHLLEYTGLIVIDIDNLKPKEVKAIQKECKDDDFLYCCFMSPSGGIKLLYEVDAPAEYHKTASFEQLKAYVEEVYGQEVDKSGKNISRLCYISYDPEIYINKDYICFGVDVEAYEKKENERVIAPPANYDNEGEVSHDVEFIWMVAKGWLDTKGEHYAVNNRNNYIHKMACILNRAGVHEHQINQLLTRHHSISKDMYGEMLTTVSGVSKRYRGEFGSKPIYDKRKKNNNSLLNYGT
jgi:hypothetical protein